MSRDNSSWAKMFAAERAEYKDASPVEGWCAQSPGRFYDDPPPTTLRGVGMPDAEEWFTRSFDTGYGGTDGCPFHIWTSERIYFATCYDGAEWIGSMPRNPKSKRREAPASWGRMMSAALDLTAPTASSVLAELRGLTSKDWRITVDGSADEPGQAAIVTYKRTSADGRLLWLVQVLVEPAQGWVPEPTLLRPVESPDAGLLAAIQRVRGTRWVPVATPVRAEPGWSSAWLRDHGRSAS